MSSSTKTYDVVGGGIHGVGIAQAAAAAGYSVLVIEQKALAHGTSSKSSKLIHGGLRYLETLQIKLVFECLSERSKLLKLAPDLVKLEPFNIPVYKHTRRRPWEIFAGLRVLPHAKGRAFSSPRETTFHVDKKLAPRVVTIYGGKLTAYRTTSEKFVKRFSTLLPKRTRKAWNSNLQLKDS